MLIPFDKIYNKYKMNIRGILHIGAHKCEEQYIYNKFGINNDRIIWVEANPNLVIENLKKDSTIIIKNFICCEKDTGTTTLNIANNGASSSVYEFGTHNKYFPTINFVNTIKVRNNRIDTMYKKEKIPENFANFLNIDIQGAELLALKGMGNLLNNFDYAYLEVNRDYSYKNCCLIGEIDDFLKKFDFVRVETEWTIKTWGDALYVKINKNLKLLKNVRCSQEFWTIKNITLRQAILKARSDPRVKALHWYKKNGGDGRINNINGWYQGAGGDIGVVKNNDWDTIVDEGITKFSLCIPTMDRYDDFLSKNIPLYLEMDLIDEIIISDENGNDVEKIKKNIKKLGKIKFKVNEHKKGAFHNKLQACKMAKNEWIVLIDSDNFADIEYFCRANNYLKKINDKNVILAPSKALPNFDYSVFSNFCFRRESFKNIKNIKKSSILMNTGNFVINKYLIENLKLTKVDLEIIEKAKCCDVILFNIFLFEKLNLNMYVVPNLFYNHNVHPNSNYIKNSEQNKDFIDFIHNKYYNLISKR